MRALWVCLLVGCGSAPRPATGLGAGGQPPAAVGIRAERDPVEVRQLSRGADLAPEPVEYVPAVTELPYGGDDIDEQIAMRERLLSLTEVSAERVEQWVAIASLFIQKGQTNRAERAYMSAATEPAFSTYARADEVLFRAGMLLRSRGELVQARKLFLRLIKDHPASSWVADAYVQFGDYYFEQGEDDKADKFYEKAVQLGEERTLGYARYKLGWCRLRQGNGAGALEQFLSAARDGAARSPDLARAAVRAFVHAYPGVGRPDRAFVALRRLDADSAGDMFARLGEEYATRGMSDESATVFDKLGDLVDAGEVSGDGVTAAFSARARDELAAGRTEPADAYIARFPTAEDAGELAYYLADAAWRRAARAQDLAIAAEQWDRTAAMFERAIDLGGLAPAQIADAESAATVARHNARAARSARK